MDLVLLFVLAVAHYAVPLALVVSVALVIRVWRS